MISFLFFFLFFSSHLCVFSGCQRVSRLRTAEAAIKTEETERHWQASITGRGKGNGLSVRFEQYVREILATGCSAKAARGTIAMSANVCLNGDA